MYAGYLFAYGFEVTNVDWVADDSGATGTFDLGQAGDSILVYCIDADSNPRFIMGFSFAPGGWADPGLSADEYGPERSALPDDLKEHGNVAVPYFQNNIYNGTTSAQKADLLDLFADPTNYDGSNTIRYDIEQLNTSGGLSVGFGFSALAGAVAATAAALSVMF